ncbi:hypothetical protein IWQ60_004937 [Tieghemiomyces parasiticus]|uniref:Uncharacterized protein n=1 Tax=Tieghemiomyces parasiticus TaxID=78921 RepID=A0A9W8ADC1_9FUNG|nr:hypothetical protein IWQ60_004937 [Tieghemiomyces parasiticus]
MNPATQSGKRKLNPLEGAPPVRLGTAAGPLNAVQQKQLQQRTIDILMGSQALLHREPPPPTAGEQPRALARGKKGLPPLTPVFRCATNPQELEAKGSDDGTVPEPKPVPNELDEWTYQTFSAKTTDAMLRYLSAPLGLAELIDREHAALKGTPSAEGPDGGNAEDTCTLDTHGLFSELQLVGGNLASLQAELREFRTETGGQHEELREALTTSAQGRVSALNSHHEAVLEAVTKQVLTALDNRDSRLVAKLDGVRSELATHLTQLDAKFQTQAQYAETLAGLRTDLAAVANACSETNQLLTLHGQSANQNYHFIWQQLQNLLHQQNLVLQALVEIKTEGVYTQPRKPPRKTKPATDA